MEAAEGKHFGPTSAPRMTGKESLDFSTFTFALVVMTRKICMEAEA